MAVFVSLMMANSDLLYAQEELKEQLLQLESRVISLEQYVDQLATGVDQQLQFANRRTVQIDLFSKSFQEVKTNAGTFLVSVAKILQKEEGYNIALKIGNISHAAYSGFKLRLRWGKAWNPQIFKTLNEWRNSLTGIEYEFSGRLNEGTWTEAELHVAPATWEQLRYAELEMDVKTVELISQ